MKETTIQPYRPLELMIDPKITDFDCRDFIGIWDKFVPASFCDQLIEWYEHMYYKRSSQYDHEDQYQMISEQLEPFGSTYGEKDQDRFHKTISPGEIQYGSNLNRKDTSVMLNYCNDNITYQVNQFLKSCMMHYISEFGQLKQVSMFSSDIKMQKTEPEGGYHLWHYENSAGSHANRELVWMIYLNDVLPENGGETEFMYQRRRLNPTKGTVVIFPAGMTHVHRGNMVLDGDAKYILTGWYIKS
tara:strand:+ start:18082 stop:18813 length:732 start_codon:yes stop_codon:yes gene_type:complete